MKTLRFLLLVTCSGIALSLRAQSQPSEIDPAIKEMVHEISSANLKSIIDKLVTFDTRHSLSTVKSANKGIGAARNWVEGEFKKYAAASNGRLTVKQDTFTVFPDGKRVNRQVVMANVMATLKGIDPETSWAQKFFVKENEATLPYSKDNYLFAVQSVDEYGHTCLQVIPKPAK